MLNKKMITNNNNTLTITREEQTFSLATPIRNTLDIQTRFNLNRLPDSDETMPQLRDNVFIENIYSEVPDNFGIYRIVGRLYWENATLREYVASVSPSRESFMGNLHRVVPEINPTVDTTPRPQPYIQFLERLGIDQLRGLGSAEIDIDNLFLNRVGARLGRPPADGDENIPPADADDNIPEPLCAGPSTSVDSTAQEPITNEFFSVEPSIDDISEPYINGSDENISNPFQSDSPVNILEQDSSRTGSSVNISDPNIAGSSHRAVSSSSCSEQSFLETVTPESLAGINFENPENVGTILQLNRNNILANVDNGTLNVQLFESFIVNQNVPLEMVTLFNDFTTRIHNLLINFNLVMEQILLPVDHVRNIVLGTIYEGDVLRINPLIIFFNEEIHRTGFEGAFLSLLLRAYNDPFVVNFFYHLSLYGAEERLPVQDALNYFYLRVNPLLANIYRNIDTIRLGRIGANPRVFLNLPDVFTNNFNQMLYNVEVDYQAFLERHLVVATRNANAHRAIALATTPVAARAPFTIAPRGNNVFWKLLALLFPSIFGENGYYNTITNWFFYLMQPISYLMGTRFRPYIITLISLATVHGIQGYRGQTQFLPIVVRYVGFYGWTMMRPVINYLTTLWGNPRVLPLMPPTEADVARPLERGVALPVQPILVQPNWTPRINMNVIAHLSIYSWFKVLTTLFRGR